MRKPTQGVETVALERWKRGYPLTALSELRSAGYQWADRVAWVRDVVGLSESDSEEFVAAAHYG